MLKLYGHPFSSYTWKALIPFYANDLPFAFLTVEDAEHAQVVQAASPLGKFPILADGHSLIFETTTIIEHLAQHHLPQAGLISTDPDAAIETRKMDRVFDHYVMNVMQETVNAYLRDASNPDQVTIASVRDRLERVYRWLDNWLATYDRLQQITLIECAAAPSLFYATGSTPSQTLSHGCRTGARTCWPCPPWRAASMTPGPIATISRPAPRIGIERLSASPHHYEDRISAAGAVRKIAADDD